MDASSLILVVLVKILLGDVRTMIRQNDALLPFFLDEFFLPFVLFILINNLLFNERYSLFAFFNSL